jgi:RNA polymerase sigma factor (sigma-70 family)
MKESTASLLLLLKQGDISARDRLIARYLPLLRRWTHGRLPALARDLNDTDDLVQITLMSALKNLEQFESRHEGALLAYLRTSVMNAMRGEMRRAGRAGATEHRSLPREANDAYQELLVEPELQTPQLNSDQWLDYERALLKLSAQKREAVLLRLEFGMSYAEIAAAMDSPSEAAASMMVTRALVELAQYLQ